MKCLVTGGKGFIGTHLVERLIKDKNDVVILDIHDNFDIKDYDTVDVFAKDVDIIFHLAAVVGVEQASANPLKVMDTELKGTKNVLEAAINNSVRKVVYASSSEVYGGSLKFPLREDESAAPLSTYGVSKLACEHMCNAYYEKKGLQTSSLRIFNAYGPRQDDRFVVPKFIRAATFIGKIPIYNDGAQTRDFTYIDDVIEAFIKAAEGPPGQVFNVATGRETSIRVLAEKIAGMINPRPKFEYIRPINRKPEFEIPRRVGDINKSKNSLLFEAKTSLEEGLKLTIPERTAVI